MIQTYQPDHYAIATAAKQDYEGFFEMEMSYRRLLKYPPVYNMMVVLVMSEDRDAAEKASEKLAAAFKQCGRTLEHVRIIGPSDASISRLNDVYRRVIYIKALGMEALIKLREAVDGYEEENVSVAVDVNPMTTY